MDTLRLKRFKTVPGKSYGTPKEVWGFRTPARRGGAVPIAKQFLSSNADVLGLAGINLRRSRVVESLGARHVIFQQHLDKLRIHRAYVTVHVAHGGRIYLAKNRAVPLEFAKPAAPFTVPEATARKRALESVSKKAGAAKVLASEAMWLPVKSVLRPSYRVRIQRKQPRQDWIIYVDGNSGRVVHKYDNLSAKQPLARVFDPNPVIALGGRTDFPEDDPPANAYRSVRLRDLKRSSKLDGKRVTTKLTRKRAKPRSDGKFWFASDDPAFEEVMAYFHIDAAIRYLESLGYKGSRAIFKKAVPVDANGTEDDNSWYSPHDESLTFGLGGIDDAEDAEIILHELGHAIQDAICHDFGQSREAAAMGEGFGDYFAASFFADRKSKLPRYRASVGSWDAVENDDFDPPCLRRLDEELTYESFEHADGLEHENGQIWSATLWDVHEKIGRQAADRIILDSHFQLDAFTTFARGARAILDADRNLYSGRHLKRLTTIFHRRGIGPVVG